MGKIKKLKVGINNIEVVEKRKLNWPQRTLSVMASDNNKRKGKWAKSTPKKPLKFQQMMKILSLHKIKILKGKIDEKVVIVMPSQKIMEWNIKFMIRKKFPCSFLAMLTKIRETTEKRVIPAKFHPNRVIIVKKFLQK